LHGIPRSPRPDAIAHHVLERRSHRRSRPDARHRQRCPRRQAPAQDPADADDRRDRPIRPFAELRAQLFCDALAIQLAS